MATLAFNFSFAAVPKRIALLPFEINADKDLSFLKGGTFEMLTSRLSKSRQVEVLSKAPVEAAINSIVKSGAINETTARRIGTRLNADFVLFGSLTIFGNNVSVDAKMVDVFSRKPTMIFFDQSQELGAIISIINLIAADINAKMIGSTQVAVTAKAPAAQATTPAAKPEPTSQTEIYAHPEKILQEEGYITHDKTQDAETRGNIKGATQESQPQFGKSKAKNTIIEDELTTNFPPPKDVIPEKKEPQTKTELQIAVAPSPKITPSSEIENVDERTVRRENWILSQDATYYTIQIMGVHNEEFLLSFIKKNQLLKQNENAYYQSTFNNKAWYQLLYGIYPTKKEAQLAVNKLPENIRKAKPWIRSISTVQKAIRDRLKRRILELNVELHQKN
jgi:septal ring-binding cell division protein DamX